MRHANVLARGTPDAQEQAGSPEQVDMADVM
jgi:hypothetical protein